MADAEVATLATDGEAPPSTVDSVEPPSSSSDVPPVDLPPPTVNGVPEPAAQVAVDPAVTVTAVEEAPPKLTGAAGPSLGAPRIDVSDETERVMSSKYEVHDKESEIADRVAAVLKSARLQVSLCRCTQRNVDDVIAVIASSILLLVSNSLNNIALQL